MSVIAEQALDLPPAQRLQLIDEIWRSLSADPDQIPVPELLLNELEARRKRYQTDPSTLGDWDDLKQTIIQQRGKVH